MLKFSVCRGSRSDSLVLVSMELRGNLKVLASQEKKACIRPQPSRAVACPQQGLAFCGDASRRSTPSLLFRVTSQLAALTLQMEMHVFKSH
jgi:hypothetical protein